tara:strand:- start:19 stop:576 length:558 start_codon:yes stop_codon:yes gene_type:complete
MALWGNNDNLNSAGTVVLNYSTGVVTGTGTTFGAAGAGHTEAQVGDIIRFGIRNGATSNGFTTYFGDAVIVKIDSLTSLTIGSTANLNAGAIGPIGTSFTISQCPKSTVTDSNYSQLNTDKDTFVYGISTTGSQSASGTAYETGVGWVGITTYKDQHGTLRVKKEILVAMSGITTGNRPAFPGQK